jgi:hypothetical protein
MKRKWFYNVIVRTFVVIAALLSLSAAAQLAIGQVLNLLNREIARQFAQGVVR